MRARPLLAALSLLLIARATEAQRMSGVVRDTATREPLAGVVVTLLDSLRAPVRRVITDAVGRYSIIRSANAPYLRVMRIGYQPSLFGLPPQVEMGDVVDIAMMRVATLLSTVVVNDDRVCSVDRERTGALSLWEQARAGLLTAVVAREQMPARATVMSYERTLDAGDARLLKQESRRLTGQTSRPFSAGESPAALSVHGYLLRRPDGDQVLAPDADVLLDDSFAATHCFTVRASDAAHAGLMGLAFEPARGRDTLLDVRGTLWLESGVPSLHSLEFQYAGRLANGDLRGADGWIHFRAMANGVVFIDEWQVRLPVLQKRIVMRGAPVVRVVQRTESGGVVLDAVWPDGLRWQSALAPLTGVVRERGASTPIAGAVVSLEFTKDSVVTDSVGRFAMHPVLPGRYVVHVADTTFGAFIQPRATTREVQVVHGQPVPLDLELVGRGESVKEMCDGVDVRGITSILIGRVIGASGASPSRDMRLTARWLIPGVVESGGVATVRNEFETVDPDDAGRFSFCALPRDQPIRLSATRPNIEFADTLVTIDPRLAVMSVEWRMDLRTLASLVPPRPTVLRGRVVRAGTTTPLPGADVWIPALDRHATTDDAGEFRLDSLRAGPQFIQVRRVGFAPVRDTLTLSAGTELRREFTLIAQSQVLDTVRTVASGGRYISPALRGFEERRAGHMGGYFLTDSTLRRYDSSNLASVLMGRVSGLMLSPGQRGTYLVSSRKICSGAVLSCSGPPSCYVTIYLDGILFYSAASHDAPVDASRLPVNELAAVEFYPSSGTGPPQYNATGSGCGVLLLWTRER